MNNIIYIEKIKLFISILALFGCFKKFNLPLKEKDDTFDNATVIEIEKDTDLANILSDNNLLKAKTVKIKSRGKICLKGALEVENLKIEAQEFINEGFLIAKSLYICSFNLDNVGIIESNALKLECKNIINNNLHNSVSYIKAISLNIVAENLFIDKKIFEQEDEIVISNQNILGDSINFLSSKISIYLKKGNTIVCKNSQNATKNLIFNSLNLIYNCKEIKEEISHIKIFVYSQENKDLGILTISGNQSFKLIDTQSHLDSLINNTFPIEKDINLDNNLEIPVNEISIENNKLEYKINSLVIDDSDFPKMNTNAKDIVLKSKKLKLKRWPLFLLNSNVEINAGKILIKDSQKFPKNLTLIGLKDNLFNNGCPLSVDGSLSVTYSFVNLFEIKKDIIAKGGVSFDKNIKISKRATISTVNNLSQAADSTFEDIENYGIITTNTLIAKSIQNNGSILVKNASLNALKTYKKSKFLVYGDLKGYTNYSPLNIFNDEGHIEIKGNLINILNLENIGSKQFIDENEKIDGKIKVLGSILGIKNSKGKFINKNSGRIDVGKDIEICGFLENLAEINEYKNLPLRFYMRRDHESDQYRKPYDYINKMVKEKTFEFNRLCEFEISAHEKILKIMEKTKPTYCISYYRDYFRYPTHYFHGKGSGNFKKTLPYNSDVRISEKYYKNGWYRDYWGLLWWCYESIFDFEVDYYEILQTPTINILGMLTIKDSEGNLKLQLQGKNEFEKYKWTKNLFLKNHGNLVSERFFLILMTFFLLNLMNLLLLKK